MFSPACRENKAVGLGRGAEGAGEPAGGSCCAGSWVAVSSRLGIKLKVLKWWKNRLTQRLCEPALLTWASWGNTNRGTVTSPNPTFLWNFQASFFLSDSRQMKFSWRGLTPDLSRFRDVSRTWVCWLTGQEGKVSGPADQIRPHLPPFCLLLQDLPCYFSFSGNPNLNLIPKPGWYCCLHDSVKSEHIPWIINHLNLTPINYRPWVSFLSVLTSHNKWGHSVSVRHRSRHHWGSHRGLWSRYAAGRVEEKEWATSSHCFLSRSHGMLSNGVKAFFFIRIHENYLSFI